jgi:hypothetical protein
MGLSPFAMLQTAYSLGNWVASLGREAILEASHPGVGKHDCSPGKVTI